MKTRTIIACLLFINLFQLKGVAQEKEKKSVWEKIYIGGGLGMQFGTTTYINVSPQVGYRVTDRFIPGLGVTYIYYQYKYQNSKEKVSTSIYGGSVFAKYFITENFFAHAEYEQLNQEVSILFPNYSTITKRVWSPSLFIGGGYSQPIGGRAFVQLMILYEVMQDRYSPYYRNNPVIRLNFGI